MLFTPSSSPLSLVNFTWPTALSVGSLDSFDWFSASLIGSSAFWPVVNCYFLTLTSHSLYTSIPPI